MKPALMINRTHLVVRLAIALLALLAFAAPATAQIEIDITEGTRDPLAIAITDMGGPSEADTVTGRNIASVVRANLERSGLFRPIDPAAFIDRTSDPTVLPRFADWRLIQSQALVVGSTSVTAEGQLRVDVRLWDVAGEEQLMGMTFSTTTENWRRAAHRISDAIYERLTGEKGYFDTRIVFVAESGPRTRRIKRLTIMDQDGANPSFLTTGGALVLSPRFSPNSQMIAYMSLDERAGRVMLLDLETNRSEVLGSFGGMTSAPRFSPDGTRVALAVENAGNTDVHVMDLSTRASRRLTSSPAIDTSPSFSPDGQRIVFTSDRSGSPQLYVMDAGGGNQSRITFGQGAYSTPVWSPRGDLIAFTRQSGGRFSIGVIRPDGSGERILTTSYLDEGPTWSPNGRVIMFSRESGPGAASQLWSVDLTGRNERRVPTPGEASDPAWSPMLP
jgi:TolB protein